MQYAMEQNSITQIPPIRPQKGKQEIFLGSKADITIYGGSAGGGKSYGLCLEPAKFITKIEGYGAVIFRRTCKQVTNIGGLWDESEKIYPYLGGTSRISDLAWDFSINNKYNEIKFSHLEYEKNIHDWQGSQIPFIGWDEITHFTKKQFFYLLSRNRSTCGIKPYSKGTCNPDSEHWLRGFIDWWIDNNTGFPIEERTGKLRYFIRVGEELIFSDSAFLLKKKYGAEVMPKSLTFIPAKLSDNEILMKVDPSYKANLLALPLVERERLLGGNWNVSESGGVVKIQWFKRYKTLPNNFVRKTQSWDTAFKDGEENDYSVCTTWGELENGDLYLIDCFIDKLTFPDLKKKIVELAELENVDTVLVEDKGSGQSLIQDLRRETKLTIVGVDPKSEKKVSRMSRASVLIEAGRVYIPLNSHWLEDFELQLKSFPKSPNDDIVDSVSQFLNYKRIVKINQPKIIVL